MSNVKRVEITGSVPFDCGQYPAMTKYLAAFSAPAFGLRVSYTPAPTELVGPNAHGGRTAHYGFAVRGDEAVSYGWLDNFQAAVAACGGRVDRRVVRDLEG